MEDTATNGCVTAYRNPAQPKLLDDQQEKTEFSLLTILDLPLELDGFFLRLFFPYGFFCKQGAIKSPASKTADAIACMCPRCDIFYGDIDLIDRKTALMPCATGFVSIAHEMLKVRIASLFVQEME